MKHRSETERIALILEAINCNSNRRGESQTRIMYKAYLSHSQLKEYLSVLLEKGLIEYQKEDRLYTITQRGIHFIQIYNQQLQISNNMFTSTNKYQSAGSTPATGFKSGESSYLTFSEVATANHRWKCEKCEKPLVSMKELKLHKFEYHSY
jgi:predicted transcriptional regulator